MLRIKLLFLLFIFVLYSANVSSHQKNGEAHYLANEGVMVSHDDVKIIFDPFFHNSYGNYTLVPQKIREAIFNNQPPFDDVNAILISHAHGDHFDKGDVFKYMLNNTKVTLFAPIQAVAELKKILGFEQIVQRVYPINLEKGENAKVLNIENIQVEAVRIPHAGWPSRKEIENIVYRVKMNNSMVVMHMGDADPNKAHFDEQASFWPKEQSDIAFPPYWFSTSKTGQLILKEVINTKKSVGIHVPTKIPQNLIVTRHDYFSIPGETRVIPND